MISWLASARRDVAQLYSYIAEHDRDAAAKIAANIYAAPQRLIQFQRSGPERNDIAVGLRSMKAGKYLLLYRIKGKNIEIVRVLHSARDLAAAFAADLQS